MTWNTTALFIDAATHDQVLPHLPGHYRYTPDELDFRSATGAALAPDVAMGQLDLPGGRHVVELWDPAGWVALDEDVVARLSRRRRVLVVYGSAITARYGFRLVQDGKLTRSTDWGGGTILSEFGEPLAAENEITARPWGHDDASLLCLAELLGFRAPAREGTCAYTRVRCLASPADLARPNAIPESFRSSMSRKARPPRRPTPIPHC